MKKLIPILFLMAFMKPAATNPPFVTAQASSVYTTYSSDTLYSIACDPQCLPVTYQWTKVSGPGSQVITDPALNSTVITGLQTGFYIFKSTVTSSTGLSASDTVGFLVNIPIIIHDTLPRVCPPPIVCPVIPPQRIAVSCSILNNIATVVYNDGTVTTFNVKNSIIIQ